jgi:hypothetical protein
MSQTKAQLIDGKSAEIEFTGGSASGPAISFTGDTNTGIYSPGADQVAVSTGGTGRLFINSSGQVGIGGSPAYMLDITTGAFNDVARFTGYNAGTLLFRNSSTDLCEIRAESGDSLAIGAGGTERLRITSAGLVGIGTTSPGAIFQAKVATDYNIAFNTDNDGVGRITCVNDAFNAASPLSVSGADLRLQISGQEKARIDSSGRLGIGTSSPGAAIHVTSSNAGGYGGVIYNTSSTGEGLIIRAGSTSSHNILVAQTYDGSASRFIVNAAGNVGIGTTSPGSALHVVGTDIRFSNSVNTSFIGSISHDAGTTGNNFYNCQDTGGHVFQLNGTEKTRVDSSGRLLVGTSTARSSGGHTGSFQLEGTTFATATAAVTANSNDSNGAYLNFGKARGGSIGSTTIVQNADVLGQIQFNGSDGASLQNAAFITALVDGTPGGGDMPGRLVFSTTADGATSPTERLRITSSGNVGIGTTAVDAPLHVAAANGAPLIKGVASTGTNACYMQLGNTAGGVIVGRDNSTGGILGGGAYATHLWAQGAYPLVFSTNSTQRAQIDSSGRLLVGTSSTSKDFSAVFQGNSADATGGANLLLARGTSSPADGSAIGYLTFTDSNHNATALIQAQRDGGTWDSGASQPGRLVFSTTENGASSPTERMRITKDGYLKQSPTGSYLNATGLHNEFNANNANSYVVITSCTNASPASEYIQDFRFSAATPNNTSARFWNCADATAVRAYMASNGGLYNYSANNSNLSDRNAKKDITPAADTWDCIKEWEIVNYRYKDEPDAADLNLGVIAQQVAESCPEVIAVFQEAKEATEDQPAQEERLGVKEQQMYWMAIKALQEAQSRIEQLESKVAALESA